MSVVEVVLKAFETDPEGASLLVDEAVGSWMADTAAVYDDLLQQVAAERVAATTALAKRALARSYVETMVDGHYPDDEVHKTARWLAGIDAYTKAVLERREVGKALEWVNRGNKRVRVYRDPATGEWARSIGPGHVNPLRAPQPSPALGDLVLSNLAPEQVRAAERHQHQWETADRYAREMAAAWPGSSKDVDIGLLVLHPDGRQELLRVPLREVHRRGLHARGEDINPLEDRLLSVQVVPGEKADPDTLNRVTRFNTVGMLGSDQLARFAGTSGADWAAALRRYEPSEQESRLRQLFGNMGAAGRVLGAVPGGEKAGAFVGLAGQLGPQAETVLGPHVRRAAYRYRGTEKTPDDALRRAYASQEMAFTRGLADATTLPMLPNGRTSSRNDVLEQRLGARRKGEKHNPVVGSALYRTTDTGVEGDQLKLEVASDVAASHLVSTLPPDPIHAKLSETSGHVLPSHGVLLDADGNLVSQAVGYADDHYLPFDLRNIGRLRGGQYVRTRVQGGLTGEDVYAAVQSGARMVTVVSSSGVYSMELDPTFRGARGNSDKARAMYGRYLQILDAVQNSGLYLQDITGAQKDRLRQQVRELYPDADEKRFKEYYDEALERERLASAQGIDIDALQAQARAKAEEELPAGSTQEIARRTEDVYYDLQREAAKDKVDKLALNAQGYQVALETLQQQFPYFIRKVTYEPLTARGTTPGFFQRRGLEESPAKGRASGAEDRGYVRPGGLRPASVKGGFYNPASPAEVAGTPEAKPRVGEKKTEPPPQPTPPPGAPGEQGEAPAGRVRATGKGLLGQLANYSQKATLEANQKAQEMAAALSQFEDPGQHANGGKTWEEVRNGPPIPRVQQILENRDSIPERLQDPAALEAMLNPGALKQGFHNVWPAQTVRESLEDNDTMQALFGGAKDSTGVLTWLHDQVSQVAAAANLADPFGPVTQDPFAVGHRPQAFQDLVGTPTEGGFTTPAQVALFAGTPKGARLVNTWNEVGASPEGARKALDVLKRAHAVVPKARAQSTATQTPFDTELLAGVAGNMTESDLRNAAGGAITSPANAEDFLRQRALEIQRAWTLDQVRRSVEVLEGPKEEGSFEKSDPPESWSRRAQVLEWEHPLVLPVLLAKSAGRLPSRRHQL